MVVSRRTDAFTADEVCAILGMNLRQYVLLCVQSLKYIFSLRNTDMCNQK